VLGDLQAAGLQTTVYSDVQPELPVASLDAAGAFAREHRPDAILAIGGGSALDAAKLIALLATHDGPLSRYYGENAVPGPVVPVIAVPTTAGTGSEATPVAVISDPERELKVGISSPFLVPAAAVVDPELTLGAPPSVTAHSGIDALVHLVESYTASPLAVDWAGALPVFTGRNLFSDLIALDGVRRLGTWLPVAYAQPGDREAREQVAFGSLLGGMSFGPTGTHLSHALQYPIGALTKTPHGLGTGLMLPYVLDAFRSDTAAAARIAQVGVALGSTSSSSDEQTDDAISTISALNRAIGLPPTLAELGLAPEQLPRVAELALGSARLVAISPVPATYDLLLRILENAHAGSLAT
jgi:alcohol dehydrogenase